MRPTEHLFKFSKRAFLDKILNMDLKQFDDFIVDQLNKASTFKKQIMYTFFNKDL
jgi:hypothetical protein